MADDDPFACFGSDDDLDDNSEVDFGDDARSDHPTNNVSESVALEEARRLAKEANARREKAELGIAGNGGDESATETNDNGEDGRSEDDGDDDKDGPKIETLPSAWPSRPPLYLGPMVSVRIGAPLPSSSTTNSPPSSFDERYVGGGRGYVASRYLHPGTLLLVEEPIMLWPKGSVNGNAPGLEAAEAILEREDAVDILRDVEGLHPTLTDVDYIASHYSETMEGGGRGGGGGGNERDEQIIVMMSALRARHSSDPRLRRLLAAASERDIVRSDGRSLTESDIYRTLLAMRYNGFESGLYLHFALFNHDDNPNCVKFLPEDSGATVATSADITSRRGETKRGGQPPRRYSEVRTTRPVLRGEALTLHYLNPWEVCHAERRRRLWGQHRFDVGADIGNSRVRDMELVGGEVPPSSATGEPDVGEEDGDGVGGGKPWPPTFYVEHALTELEDMLRSVKGSVASLPLADASSSSSAAAALFRRAGELELAALEFVDSALSKLANPRHVLLIRCLRLHLDTVEAVTLIGSKASREGGGLAPMLGADAACVKAMGRMVPTAHRLLGLQIYALGPDHPDVARTYYDLAEAVETLLSRSPRILFKLDVDGMGGNSFAVWAREEDRCRKEHRRIDALYARDVEQRIRGEGGDSGSAG